MYIKFDTETIWANDGSFKYAFIESEVDLNGRAVYVEELGDLQRNIYRESKSQNKQYTLTLRLGAGPRWAVPDIVSWWEALHTRRGGERVVERKMESGKVLQLIAVPETPQWSDVGESFATVTQVYTAALPLWRESVEESASAAYTAAVPTTLSFDNKGDVPSWVRLHYAGPVTDPWVGYSTEWEIEWDLDILAADVLDVNAMTHATAVMTPGIGAAYNAYGLMSSSSSFRLAQLPVGAGTLDMVASAGNGVLTCYWYHYYEAFR